MALSECIVPKICRKRWQKRGIQFIRRYVLINTSKGSCAFVPVLVINSVMKHEKQIHKRILGGKILVSVSGPILM